MTVKRYRPEAEGYGSGYVHPDDSGDYVSYDDYAALQQQVNALAVENRELKSAHIWINTVASGVAQPNVSARTLMV